MPHRINDEDAGAHAHGMGADCLEELVEGPERVKVRLTRAPRGDDAETSLAKTAASRAARLR